jgi:hypothetical protein
VHLRTLETWADCRFAHYGESIIFQTSQSPGSKKIQAWTDQSAISDEHREMLVLALVDLLFQDAQRHRLLNDVIIVGDIPLVYTSLEKSRRIVATAISMDDQPGASTLRTFGKEK